MELSDEEQELVQISHPIIIELIARFISIIQLLRERNHELENRNRELENRSNLNSSNCSIPPSKNPLNHKKIPNSRVPSGKNLGGQDGHIGTTLSPVKSPIQ